MDDPALTPQPIPEPEALTALTARVAELERMVATLQGRKLRTPFLPHREAPTQQAAAPPPMPGAPPFRIPMPSLAAAAATKPARSLEDRLGAQVFNMVGIVAIIVASAYGLKLAIEHGYLGPVARVLIGLAAGVATILWSERFRRKGFAAFSYSLKAIGSAVLYLTLWAAFQLYHLLPASAVLVAMIVVTAWNAFMALTQDAELLAAYALLGGFMTPLLLSTGGNHETFLFTYIAALDLATVVLLRSKPWRRLLVPAFLGTVLFFIGWYSSFYRYDLELHQGPFAQTIAFLFLLWAIFAVVSIQHWMKPEADTTGKTGDVLVPVLLPLANAAFLALAMYSVFQDSGLHSSLAFLMVGLAAVYLGLMRVQRTAVAAAMHLAIAVILLTAAIPLKASGHTLTAAWLVEGLALFWVSTRFNAEQQRAARALRILSAAGYVLGLASLVIHWFFLSIGLEDRHPPFLNHNLGAALVAVATLAGAIWLLFRQLHADELEAEPHVHRRSFPTLLAALAAIDLVALLLIGRELGSIGYDDTIHTAFTNADFGTALVGLALLAANTWAALRLYRVDPLRFAPLQRFAGITSILFNLFTILCVEREIGALWHHADANLQRSLAISGFLMAYGAALLTIGFWRRIAFVRWQALALLLFTICKVFLYDIGSLSAGYRVVSFFGLGAVLMAVSFAYQKDWLGLKTTAPVLDETDSNVTDGPSS